jgi:orotidine-5'-phosphate decarboxylase
MTGVANPVCLALDSRDRDRIMGLVSATADHVGMFKVGLTAFGALGPGIVVELTRTRPVFLDLKFHDIPAQVEGAVGAVAELGASYTTIHAAAGTEAIKAGVAAAGDECRVLAVTVLTSVDDSDLRELGMAGPVAQAVLRLAEVAVDAGAPGLVCSPLEVAPLRDRFGSSSEGGPMLVVPGVRPAKATRGDQKRTLSPREAVEAGADVIVVGRPITEAADPGAAARSMLEEAGA